MKQAMVFGVAFLTALTAMVHAPAAVADPAVATAYVNVRSGPASSSRVVDVLEEGELVETTECQGGWCYVNQDGPDGWVYATYLAPAPNLPAATVTPAQPALSGVAPSGNEACFYAAANYGGQAFCSGSTVLNELPGEADNVISSVRLSGMALARLCAEPGLAGECVVISSDTPQLDTVLDNQVSSMRIYLGTAPAEPATN